MNQVKQIITITSGVGPQEVREFVRLLADRIIAVCEAAGFPVMAVVPVGENRAPHSVHLTIKGDVHQALAGEIGTHCLVARSAHRGRKGRKRWFAKVTISEQDVAPDRSQGDLLRDLEITACRAGGPGGQHVNKTNSAVRVRHRPSGVCIKVMEQRSQHANHAIAVKRISRELQRREEETRETKKAYTRAGHYQVERGRPIREYRLNHHGGLERLDGSRNLLSPLR